MTSRRNVNLRVNGVAVDRHVEPRMLLSDFLREELDLTGTHVGCEHGVCGACTVLLDGKSVRSCLLLAVQAEDAVITTVEGIGDIDRLHPLQQAFWDNHGLQCGFCTPGMLMTAIDIIANHPCSTEADLRDGLSGNLCRCTGYQNIVAAVREAAEIMRNDQIGSDAHEAGSEA